MMAKHLIVLLLGLLASGCANTPNTQFYVLEPISQTAPPKIEAVTQKTIGIGPVTVPELLDRSQIITRSSNHTVNIAESQQWASPLQDNLLQTLTRNLSSLQSNNIVRPYPWSVHGKVDLQVIVDFIRFDTSPGKSANLEANWTIKNESTHAVLKSGHSVINRAMSDASYPGAVHALSKILGEFSQELSLALFNVQKTY